MPGINTYKLPWLFIILLLFFIPGSYHKYYVSLTEIRFNIEQNSMEVNIHLFADDMDRAIETIHGVNPQVGTALENEMGDQWIKSYLSENIDIQVRDESVELKYIGKEAEGEAIWIYLEGRMKMITDTVYIQNTIFTELFDDQKNIIQVYWERRNHGLILDRYHTSGDIIAKKK
mgnify:CR=1 FL=1